MKPWPTDAVMVVAPVAGTEVKGAAEPTVERRCRTCSSGVVVRASTLRAALRTPLRYGRPVDFFCVGCAAGHDRGRVGLLDLRTPFESEHRQ